MPVRTGEAVWEGGLLRGKGTIRFGEGRFSAPYSAGSRFAGDAGTNPEELIAAAHSGCFSMALAGLIEKSGYEVTRLRTQARVRIEREAGGYRISTIELDSEAVVPGMDEGTFLKRAEEAKSGCPVSKALAGAEIHVNARLAQ